MPTTEQVAQWFENNWLTVATFVLGVAVSYVVYRWQHKDKRPRYSVRNYTLVRDAKTIFPGLHVSYSQPGERGRGSDLENFSVANVVIWNDGRETIHRADITEADPLAVVATGDTKILGASKIGENNLPNKAGCNHVKDENRVLVSFDYLDQGHGVVLQVFHTGTSHGAVAVQGTFKGCGKIVYRDTQYRNPAGLRLPIYRRRSQITPRERRFIGLFCMAFSVVMMAVYLYLGISAYRNLGPRELVEVDGKHYALLNDNPFWRVSEQGGKKVATTSSWPMVVTLVVIPALLLMSFFLPGYRLWRGHLPKGLEQFEDPPH